ncbi:MAG TPA: class I SAM-dependent methyltransferase [Pyrinomonadaceae bacterium]
MAKVFNPIFSFSPIKKSVVWGWYQCLSALDKEANMTFMNYGYADLNSHHTELELLPEDRANRYCIQLYQRVAGGVDLRGKDLLEIGSGRGGGSSFIMRYLGPGSMTGVDLSSKAVAFCNRHYRHAGLSFQQASAEKLPFPADSFDAVINVESSHCYNSVPDFLREVVRVMRPAGHFLFADLRPREEVALLREQLGAAGLRILEEEQIGSNVVRALDLDSERKTALIRTTIPKLLRERFLKFAGTKGSPVYKLFESGEWQYLRFVMQKS